MAEIRAGQKIRQGVQATIQGLVGGSYTITPYDTFQGSFLTPFDITCSEGQPCQVALPDFKADMAFKIARK